MHPSPTIAERVFLLSRLHIKVTDTCCCADTPEQREQSEQSRASTTRQLAEMAATTTASMGSLPRGLGICTTAPDILYLPELVSGGTRAEGQAADLEVHQQGNRNLPFLSFFLLLRF